MSLLRVIQTNFTSGVLDAKLAAREDITFYYNGLASAKNLVSEPQGGLTRRPGKEFLRKLARQLTEIDISAKTVTVPHGGTADNLKDSDDTTYVTTADDLTNIDPFVVVRLDLGAAMDISAIDAINYKLESGAISGEFRLQHSLNDAAWSDFGEPMDIDASDRSRRRRPSGGKVSVRYVRFVRIGDTNLAATVSIARLRLWQESADLSPAKLFPFAYSSKAAYMLVQSDRNIDVLSGREYVTSIRAPHSAAQLPVVTTSQRLDTMLQFHEARQPWKIFRQGGDSEFDFRYADLENLPEYDYGVPPTGASAGVNEVQTITGSFTGGSFRITLEGKKTNYISGTSDQNTVATRIQSALRNLANTSATGITVTYAAGNFTVTFGGADGLRPWEKMVVDDETAVVTRTTVGQFAGIAAGDEVQTLNVAGTASGDKFTIEFEGYTTNTITVGATDADTVTNIQSALRALKSIDGDTGLTVNDVTDGFAVVFSGDKLGNRPHTKMKVFVLKGNGVWDVARTTRGRLPGEAIISETRGWPRCGLLHQSRLNLAGMPGVPDGWIASVVNDRYNFDTELETPEKGLAFQPEEEQVGTIYDMVAAQHLTFFLSDSVMYNPSEAINESSVMKFACSEGAKAGLPKYEVDGGLIYVQGVLDEETQTEIGTSIRQLQFDELKQRYQSNILSKFSASLIRDPVSCALRKGLSTEESDLYLLVNNDGTAIGYTILSADQVNAFMPIETRPGDKLISVGVDKRQNVYWVTERMIDGAAERYVERWNKDLQFDCGSTVTVTAEEFSAAEGQADYTWTFDNPVDAAAVGVRLRGGRLASAEFMVDLLTKTVSLIPSIAATVAAGDKVRIAKMLNEVTDADHLEGETIQTYIDGNEGPDCVVAAGTFSLPDYADTEIQYGFDFEVSGKLMPFRVPGGTTLVDKKLRVVNAIFQLYRTANMQIRANDGDWQDLPLVKLDGDILDRTAEELLFTGEIAAEGLLGFAVGGVLEFRQAGPGPFTILSATREVSV